MLARFCWLNSSRCSLASWMMASTSCTLYTPAAQGRDQSAVGSIAQYIKAWHRTGGLGLPCSAWVAVGHRQPETYLCMSST